MSFYLDNKINAWRELASDLQWKSKCPGQSEQSESSHGEVCLAESDRSC